MISKCDIIRLENMRVGCFLGLLEKEKKKKQKIRIDLWIYTDVSLPEHTDDIKDAVDYRIVEKNIIRFVSGSAYSLLEALAGGIAEKCLTLKNVTSVRVRITKYGILKYTKSAGIEIIRHKK